MTLSRYLAKRIDWTQKWVDEYHYHSPREKQCKAAVPVLEFGCFLQELEARMREEDACHHGLEVIWGHMPAPLLPQDVKHAPHWVHLDSTSSYRHALLLFVFPAFPSRGLISFGLILIWN